MLNLFEGFLGRHPYTVFESICVFIPFYIGFFRRAKLNYDFRCLLFYPALLFFTDIPLWLTAINGMNNRRGSNLQEILCSAFLFFVLYKMIARFSKKQLCLALTGLVFISVLNFDFFDFSGLMFTYVRAIYIVLSFVFFFELLENMEIDNLLTYGKFWFFAGLFLSSLGTILIYYFTRYTSYYEVDYLTFTVLDNLTHTYKFLFVGLMSVAFLFDTKPKAKNE
jgi:hypothetical protein